MKKAAALLLASVMIVAMTACGSSDKGTNTGSSVSGTEISAEAEKNDKGSVSEEKAVELAVTKAEMDFQNEDITVDESSGRILDQNDTAYIVGLDIIDDYSGNYMYIEAYWVHKQSGEAKDVCIINEYYDGLIDVTNGEPLF